MKLLHFIIFFDYITFYIFLFLPCANVIILKRPFVIEHNVIVDSNKPSAPLEGGPGAEGLWCSASGGMVPPDAVEGGNDGEPLFVGRAQHEGALIPGKVKPSHSVCYIAWGGAEHGKSDYEVSNRTLLTARYS